MVFVVSVNESFLKCIVHGRIMVMSVYRIYIVENQIISIGRGFVH